MIVRANVQTDKTILERTDILGPIVRFAIHPFLLNGDEYKQDENLVFTTKHAVFIPGEVLLEQGMYDTDPMLREGFAVNDYAPYEYLASTFDLQGTVYGQ